MTKSIFGKFRKLEKKKKLQLVIAVSISVVLLVALPVYAWFTHKRSIALTTKINAPTQLYITAGNKESVANLEMADIDVENGSYKDFVFGIGGADVQQYQIQLAHTTNIPFEYEIYRAKRNIRCMCKLYLILLHIQRIFLLSMRYIVQKASVKLKNQKLSFMFQMKRIKRFITK